MTLQSDLEAAVAQTTTDSDLLHDIVHGGITVTVTTEGGIVKSVAKLEADIEAELESNNVISQISTIRNEAQAAATDADNSATAAQASADQAAAYLPDLQAGDATKLLRVKPTEDGFELVASLSPGYLNIMGALVADGSNGNADYMVIHDDSLGGTRRILTRDFLAGLIVTASSTSSILNYTNGFVYRNPTTQRIEQVSANTLVKSTFSDVLSSTGWVQLPTGLIIQWGGGTGGTAVTYPLAFSAWARVCVATLNDATYAAADLRGTTGFTPRVLSSGGSQIAGSVDWFAFGF